MLSCPAVLILCLAIRCPFLDCCFDLHVPTCQWVRAAQHKEEEEEEEEEEEKEEVVEEEEEGWEKEENDDEYKTSDGEEQRVK